MDIDERIRQINTIARDSATGRFVSMVDAEARPAETTTEQVKHVDIDALAAKIHEMDAPNSVPFGQLSQERRDFLRRIVKVVLEGA